MRGPASARRATGGLILAAPVIPQTSYGSENGQVSRQVVQADTDARARSGPLLIPHLNHVAGCNFAIFAVWRREGFRPDWAAQLCISEFAPHMPA